MRHIAAIQALRVGPWPGSARAATAAAGVLLVATALMAGAAGVAAQRICMLFVLAPLVEEAILRAGLHEALLRRMDSPWAANALTALAFGLAHALARGDAAALGVALPAWLIGAVYQRSRRLRDCVALHAAMNAAWLASALVGFTLPAR